MSPPPHTASLDNDESAYVTRKSATLLMTREVIARAVSPLAYFEPVQNAFRRLAAGDIEAAPVSHLPVMDGGFHVKAAVSTRSPRRAAFKVNANFPNNPAQNGRPAIQGFIALFDADCGELLALLDSTEITARRTAACSAVAARLLARPDARRLAFIGCGVQARYHWDAFAPLFPFTSVSLFDRMPDKMAEFVTAMARTDLVTETTASAHEAAQGADILITTTPSRTALLGTNDVSSGCFIAAVGADCAGKQELTTELLLNASIVPDVLVQAIQMGELQHAVAAGLLTPQDTYAELGEIVSGRMPGRRCDEDIFIFDSTGTAITDLAAAELVFDIVSHRAGCPEIRLDA